MYETTKLCYRVSEADVIRARNQVATNAFILNWHQIPGYFLNQIVLVSINCDCKLQLIFVYGFSQTKH